MDAPEVRQILKDAKAVVTNSHFVYTSWKHGSAYINKDAIYPRVDKVRRLCKGIAAHFSFYKIEVVIAPAVGAVILSTWTAYYLSEMTTNPVLGLYADKEGKDNFVIKRGYEKLIPGKRVLVVEDLFTTGGSVEKVVRAVRELGGHVVGVAGIANRGKVTKEQVGNPDHFYALLDVEMETYEAASCPLCAKGLPINTSLGHGREFLAAQGRT